MKWEIAIEVKMFNGTGRENQGEKERDNAKREKVRKVKMLNGSGREKEN